MRDVDRVDCGGLDVTKHLVVLDVLQKVARTHSFPTVRKGGVRPGFRV
jgi:hypothetical protein